MCFRTTNLHKTVIQQQRLVQLIIPVDSQPALITMAMVYPNTILGLKDQGKGSKVIMLSQFVHDRNRVP